MQGGIWNQGHFTHPLHMTKIGNSGKESRTIHLGIDFWLPAKTPVHTLFEGEVVIAVNDAGDKEYGGLVRFKTQIQSSYFLYPVRTFIRG